MRITDKINKLEAIIRSCKSAAVAFSGGVDSALLAVLAKNLLGDKCRAVTSVAPIHDREGILLTQRLARRHRLQHVLLRSKITEDGRFISNPPDRCYICKRDVFRQLISYARQHGISQVFDGSNADDLKAHRPGRRALQELKVRSPLAEAGLTKSEIRQLARKMNISVWNKPANACLATRVPYGSSITPQILKRIENAEKAIKKLGLGQCRVRHHGDTARVEMDPGYFIKALRTREIIVKQLHKAGYKFIALDLAGYRTGCFDPVTKSCKHGKRKS